MGWGETSLPQRHRDAEVREGFLGEYDVCPNRRCPGREDRPHSVYKLFFYGLCTKPPLHVNHETEKAEWFTLEDLPELSEYRVLRQDIERLFRYHQEKGPVYTDCKQ